MRINNSHQDAEQSNTLANGLEETADMREAMIPGVFGTRSIARAPRVIKKPILTGLGQPVMSKSKGLIPVGSGTRSIIRAPQVIKKTILTGLGQPVMSNGKGLNFARPLAGPTVMDAVDNGAYGFSVRDLESDNEVDLSKYKGSVSLIVDVASE